MDTWLILSGLFAVICVALAIIEAYKSHDGVVNAGEER